MSDPKPTAEGLRGATPGGRGGFLARLAGLRPVMLVLAGVLTAGVSAGAAGSIALLRYFETTVKQVEVDLDPEPEAPTEPVNVLVLGSDTREGLSEAEQSLKGSPEQVEGARSDTIILVHLNPVRERAVLVHFPRDLLVEIPGHGRGKVNAAFELGGPNLIVRTVRQFTGLRIHHYVEMDFVGFRELVDALGGVELCVCRPMVDELAELYIREAGCYRFDGRRALAFVRARHVEGDRIPDFARIGRQQQFIRALLNELLSVDSLVRVPTIVRLVAENVTTDADLTGTDVLYLGEKLSELAREDPGGARSVDLRVVPAVPQEIDGVSYVVARQPATERLFRALERGRRPRRVGSSQVGTDISPGVIAVRVLGAEASEEAARASNLLRRAGFVVLGTEPSPGSLDESVILFRRGAADRGRVVKRLFPGLPLRRGSPALLDGADVAVVVAQGRPVKGCA